MNLFKSGPLMSNDKPDYPPIRRVVTGHDSGNVAKVLMDSVDFGEINGDRFCPSASGFYLFRNLL